MPDIASGSPATAESFFQKVTGFPKVYGYQRRLAEREGWPDLVDVPTGLGKTAAVVVSWLWKRLNGDDQTGRRLVYCLPMRTLVEQTFESAARWCEKAAPFFVGRGAEPPQAAVLMGGEAEAEWDVHPGRPQILVGTQDMLLSRALGRGYGMSRYRWPMHFGILNADCLWVFDETQLMGVGIETSAQLQAFREALGTFGAARSLWMSATLGQQQLATVDHSQPAEGWVRHTVTPEERTEEEAVRERILARKRLVRAGGLALEQEPDDAYFRRVADTVAAAATNRGGLTLVVVNRVDRARGIFQDLQKALAPSGLPSALLHSRFRPPDRERHRKLLESEGDRVVVSTQVLEAGVDVSARTLFTELAPWPSLVQRFGRCNRYGEADREGIPAEIQWIPLFPSEGSDLALPYGPAELARAEVLLEQLAEQGGDAGPESLAAIPYEAPTVVRPVVRRRDLLELFDTSPDLLGYDLDVSRFVRDGKDHDVQFFWRAFGLEAGRPPAKHLQPDRHELCRVSIRAASNFIGGDLAKDRRRLEARGGQAAGRSSRLRSWRWDPMEERWEEAASRALRPGEILLLHTEAEGYDPDLGWTGEITGKATVSDLAVQDLAQDSMGGDPGANVGRWVLLTDHLAHVAMEARKIGRELGLETQLAALLTTAARWHDVGKAHEQFQRRLLDPLEESPDHTHPGPGPWAKSDHWLRAKGVRPYFRHELASALSWLAHHAQDDARRRDLVAFLIAAHHGKVRLALRSIPGEEEPDVPETLFARGVWDGDLFPATDLPGGEALPETRLDLSPMRLGRGSWTERLLALRDDPSMGPFRLAYLECLLRAADERASVAEKMGKT